MKAQRLRVTFSRGDEMKYITHLDMMRFWERALRRAGIPLAYTEGFSPHAQIALAAPLAVGTTSDAELMDVFLAEPMPAGRFAAQVAPQLPPAVSIAAVREVGLALPSLQADVRFASYDVDVPADEATASAAVADFLARETVPWEHRRDDEVRQYDIRAQVHDIDVTDAGGTARLRMTLKNDNSGSGRPEQVVAALGLPAPSRVHRTQLVLAGSSPAREAWRKRGRFVT